MARSVNTAGRGSWTITFGSRTMVFLGLSVSRKSSTSASGLGSGFGGGGEYFGAAAARAAATSGDIARVRLGAAGGGAFSAGLGESTGEDAGDTGDWADAMGPKVATP